MRKFGWKPDIPDARDLTFAPPRFATTVPHVDLRHLLPTVYDQGQLGSCTGNSIAGAVQYERIRQGLPHNALTPSRLMLYYLERELEGTVDNDAGAQIRDGIKALAKTGTCFESGPSPWPYDIDKFSVKPPAECYAVAKSDRAVRYTRLNNTRVNDLRGCLAEGNPFVFGFTVYTSFESDAVAKGGVVPMPDFKKEKVLGGHAVLAVGYDDPTQKFIVRNSWGNEWGDAGHCYMPYAYLTNSNLADDFWTIQLVSAH